MESPTGVRTLRCDNDFLRFLIILEASANPVLKHQISLAFATLIGRFQAENCESLNESLLRIVLEKETSTPSSDYANLGGWHSAGDLLEWPYPEIGMLKGYIVEALNLMVQSTGQLPEVRGHAAPKGSFRISAWANTSRRGNYHRMHNHPGSAWSGCYYVTALNPSSTSNESIGGALEFYDPRPFTEMVDAPGSPYGQRMIVRPQPGLMVLFPSWLYHFVHPHDSDSVRVSIAFNAKWIPA